MRDTVISCRLSYRPPFVDAMDAPPSYVQCRVHPGIEDCLEHALNQEPDAVLQSEVSQSIGKYGF